MEWLTTSTILQDLRDFDEGDAWQQFVRQFHEPILAFARRLGLSTSDAEDVVQDTLLAFAEAYRKGEYDRGKGRLSQWLFGIAYRKALMQRRRVARGDRTVPAEANTASFWGAIPDERQATAIWDREWERSLLAECLRQVRREVEPQTYQAFELVTRFNRTAAQAAEELGVPATVIYNAKHRVARRIRELRAKFDEIE